MIYSASRRTDMVAFFPDDIVGKVRRSRKLEAIVFWTKDIRNLVLRPDLAAIAAHIPTVVQYTVTGLAGGVWEPRVPALATQLPSLRELATRLPRGAIQWRFDPIMPGPDLEERFKRVKGDLESALVGLDGVTVSFPDPYRHAVARSCAAEMAWPTIAFEDKQRIIAMMAGEYPYSETNGGPGKPIRLCCEADLLALPSVTQSRCINGELFAKLYGLPLKDLPKDKSQRVACGCSTSTDIGSYAMHCSHCCLYCYAASES